MGVSIVEELVFIIRPDEYLVAVVFSCKDFPVEREGSNHSHLSRVVDESSPLEICEHPTIPVSKQRPQLRYEIVIRMRGLYCANCNVVRGSFPAVV